jgi:hypothetical protein
MLGIPKDQTEMRGQVDIVLQEVQLDLMKETTRFLARIFMAPDLQLMGMMLAEIYLNQVLQVF